jgi:hypothetical protein
MADAFDDQAELIAYAKVALGHQHGLTDAESRRLNGSTVDELHRDARAMCRELGRVDLTERARDEGGRYAGTAAVGFNEAVRKAAGR